MAEATRGNIEWLLQEDPSLFSALAEKASQLIMHPEQRLQLRDEFSDLVERYNNIAKKKQENAHIFHLMNSSNSRQTSAHTSGKTEANKQ
ncbi:MAG: hypothetical protein QXT19_01615 [Candidatus Woesearchaeota archaeon]